MSKSVQLVLGGTIIALIVSLGGCGGTSYYGGYYDPYPYGGHRTVIIRDRHYYDRPGRPHRPPGYRPGGGHRPEYRPSCTASLQAKADAKTTQIVTRDALKPIR